MMERGDVARWPAYTFPETKKETRGSPALFVSGNFQGNHRVFGAPFWQLSSLPELRLRNGLLVRRVVVRVGVAEARGVPRRELVADRVVLGAEEREDRRDGRQAREPARVGDEARLELARAPGAPRARALGARAVERLQVEEGVVRVDPRALGAVAVLAAALVRPEELVRRDQRGVPGGRGGTSSCDGDLEIAARLEMMSAFAPHGHGLNCPCGRAKSRSKTAPASGRRARPTRSASAFFGTAMAYGRPACPRYGCSAFMPPPSARQSFATAGAGQSFAARSAASYSARGTCVVPRAAAVGVGVGAVGARLEERRRRAIKVCGVPLDEHAHRAARAAAPGEGADVVREVSCTATHM